MLPFDTLGLEPEGCGSNDLPVLKGKRRGGRPTLRLAAPSQGKFDFGDGEAVSSAEGEADRRCSSLPATMEGVLRGLEADPIPDAETKAMKSAIRTLGRVLRRPLKDIPVCPTELRSLFKAATPASAGVTKRRWDQVRHATLRSLKGAGFEMMPGRDRQGISAAWLDVRDALPTQALKIGISRFLSFCSRAGVEPSQVTQASFAAFHEALTERSLLAKPVEIYRATIRRWNEGLAHVPSLPQHAIPLATHDCFYSLPWDNFPASLRADVDAFLCKTANQDVFDPEYVKSVRESTANGRRKCLRELLSMLVASGFPIERIESLATLTNPINATAALKAQRKRSHNVITPSLRNKATLLCVVARHHVKNPAHADALSIIARNVAAPQKGMTRRNRERLRQFDLTENLDTLFDLPARVFDRADREKLGTFREAQTVMCGLAVELLAVAPMRIGNLTALEYDRHFVSIGKGRKRSLHLTIPGQETKTGVAFEMVVPPESARLIDTYFTIYRQRICKVSSPYLFPNARGHCRDTNAFSNTVKRFLGRETDLRMNSHLFRHLAGKLCFDENPNDIETPRLVLGHTNSRTTLRYYAEQRTDQAFAKYDQTITQIRARARRGSPLPPLPSIARRPKSRRGAK